MFRIDRSFATCMIQLNFEIKLTKAHHLMIEMAFGLLQTKWSVLKKPLQVNLKTAAKVIETCARLHNFCLREDNTIDPSNDDEAILKDIIPQNGSPITGWGYLPTVEELQQIPGTSIIQEFIIDRIGQLGLCRPTHNLLANRVELHEIGLM